MISQPLPAPPAPAAGPIAPFPKRAQRRWSGWHFLLAAAAGVALTILFAYRPEGQFFFPRCTFYTLTGLLCPGCGGLRAAHALLHGHFLEALHSNVLLVLAIPAASVWWFVSRRRPALRMVTPRAVMGIFALLVLFGVLRNLPWAPFRWLAP